MALKYHPDKNPDIPQEVFQKFQNAYEVLILVFDFEIEREKRKRRKNS